MVRHIRQNHTECVTSGDANFEHVPRGSRPSWLEIYYEVLQEYLPEWYF